MTPMVDFEYRLFHRQSLDPVAQHFIKHTARIVKTFVVHPQRKHKVAPLAFRHTLPPGHLLAGFERDLDIFQMKRGGISHEGGKSHIRVEKFHRAAPLIVRCQPIEDAEHTGIVCRRPPGNKIRADIGNRTRHGKWPERRDKE